MQSTWPAYDGSVRTSWYPVIAVLKTTSPSPTTSAPRASPTNALPSSSTKAAKGFLAGNDHRLVDAIVFRRQNLDHLRIGGGYVLADVVRSDRQLAMSAIDQHRALGGPRAAKVHQGVHRRARRPAVMDHVID